jgi:DNA polymerase V
MVKGGKRPGAGRPRGGKYNEVTKLVRIPYSRVEEVLSFLDMRMNHRVPLYSSKVRAGFPSPADDYIETYLDLNKRYIQTPAATFFVIASGDSMTNAHIHEGDMLVVDRSIEATHGKIVIAAINGELTVKRLSIMNGRVQLLPENEKYKPIDITEEQDLVIWGVVKHIMKDV